MITNIVVMIVIFGYIGYLFFERYYHTQLRKKIKLVIHVNGIRGKSTTARLIDSGLREAGYRVFTKTTGTHPVIINTNNEIQPIKRLGRANIIEQYKVLRKAVKENAEVLVIECMAIEPKYQEMTEHMILNSDITVITNVYHDHINEMGSTLTSIATSLAHTVPREGHVVIGSSEYVDIFESFAVRLNSKIHIASPYEGEEVYKTFKENISVSLKVAEVLNIDKNVFLKGFYNYYPDEGAFSIYKLNDTMFFNGFSINDPDSIERVYHQMAEKYNIDRFSILLNIRDDRSFRTEQHIKLMSKLQFDAIYLMGNNTSYVQRQLKKVGIQAKMYNEKSQLNDRYVFGMGNFQNTNEVVSKFAKGEKIL